MFEISHEKFKKKNNMISGFCEGNGLGVGTMGEAGRPVWGPPQGSGREGKVRGTRVAGVEWSSHGICPWTERGMGEN